MFRHFMYSMYVHMYVSSYHTETISQLNAIIFNVITVYVSSKWTDDDSLFWTTST